MKTRKHSYNIFITIFMEFISLFVDLLDNISILNGHYFVSVEFDPFFLFAGMIFYKPHIYHALTTLFLIIIKLDLAKKNRNFSYFNYVVKFFLFFLMLATSILDYILDLSIRSNIFVIVFMIILKAIFPIHLHRKIFKKKQFSFIQIFTRLYSLALLIIYFKSIHETIRFEKFIISQRTF